MIHNIFNFIDDLIMHVDFLRHSDSPRLKLWLINENDNCAFARLTRPEF
jgi:hypothetical protein